MKKFDSIIAIIVLAGIFPLQGLHHVEAEIWMHDGWPLYSDPDFQVSIVVADLDGDGYKELLYQTIGQVNVKKHDGTDYNSQWPKPYYSLGITTADIDNDGDLEIFIASYHDIYAWHHTGETVDNFPIHYDLAYYQRISIVSIDDLDVDGWKEIVVPTQLDSSPIMLTVIDRFGNTLPGWPTEKMVSSFYNASTIDLDLDGDKEIVIGSTTGELYAFHHTGELVNGFPVELNYSRCLGSVAVGNVNKDPHPEFFVRSEANIYFASILSCVTWDGHIQWQRQLEGYANYGPVIGDVNGDGRFEVICGSSHKIYVLDADTGLSLKNWPYHNDSMYFHFNSATLADMDSDGVTDIIFPGGDVLPYKGELYIINGWGELLSDTPIVTTPYQLNEISIFVEDIDNDGFYEMGGGGSDGSWSQICVWDTDVPVNPKLAVWPQFAHDYQHTCNYYFKYKESTVTTPTLDETTVFFIVLLLSIMIKRRTHARMREDLQPYDKKQLS